MKTMLMAMYSTAKLLKVVAGVNNYLQVFLTYQGGGGGRGWLKSLFYTQTLS